MSHHLIITDVTEMHGPFCVAGWDPMAKRMVRPHIHGANWDAAWIGPGRCCPGTTMEFRPLAARAGTYPHATEDTEIAAAGISFTPPPGAGTWLAEVGGSLSGSVVDAFDGHIAWRDDAGKRRGAHVPAGAACRSLCAIRLPPGRLGFFSQGTRLRAFLTDRDATWNLPVVAHDLLELFRSGKIEAIRGRFARFKGHVRLGLARPWSERPTECILMINGVYSY